MSAQMFVQAVVFAVLATFILAGLASLVSDLLVAALTWIDKRNEREAAEDATVFNEPTRAQIEDAAADREWADILGVLNLTEAEMRRGYQAARIAHRMDRIRTDIACNQFRRELEDFDGGAA